MHRSFLVAAFFAALPSAHASTASVAPETVFQCSFGGKQVSVTRLGSTYIYKHGPVARPEIVVSANGARKNVWIGTSGNHGQGILYLRIGNGRYSYVVFNWGGEDESGLAAFDGNTMISKKDCRSGAGFTPRWNFSTAPPSDPVADKIIDALTL